MRTRVKVRHLKSIENSIQFNCERGEVGRRGEKVCLSRRLVHSVSGLDVPGNGSKMKRLVLPQHDIFPSIHFEDVKCKMGYFLVNSCSAILCSSVGHVSNVTFRS